MNDRKKFIFAALAFAAITFSLAVRAQAQTESILYNFGPGWAGNYPDGTVVLDGAGNIYGSTQSGGSCCGIVYEMSPTSGGGYTYTVLRGFSLSRYGSGVAPTLTRDARGNLYGTTINGGDLSVNCNGTGCGVVFVLTPTTSGQWNEFVLHTFSGGPDGGNPFGSLLLGPDGSIYGTTTRGGNDHECASKYVQGCGVVFKLTYSPETAWRESVLYTFTNAIGGSGPNGGLAMDAAGNIYGTTYDILFELSPTASGPWTETTLVNFLTSGQGNSESGPIMDASGNLYGTLANFGGQCPFSGTCGTVYELSPSGSGWTESILHNFVAGGTDGAYPFGVSFDSAGNLYGVAIYGYADNTHCGQYGCGVAFELSPSSGGTWTETILHEFQDGADGNPNGLSGVAIDASGNIFGTAAAGGNNLTNCGDGCGVVFEITR